MGNWIYTNFWPVHCPLVVYQPPQHSHHTVVVGLLITSALRCQPFAFTGFERTVCIPNETVRHCCFAFRAKFRTCIWDKFCSWDLLRFALPTLSHQTVQTLETANHGRISDSSLSGCCVLLSMWYLVVLMVSRSGIAAFSMCPFDGLSRFTASPVVTSAWYISATQPLNAMIAGSVSLLNVTSRQPSESTVSQLSKVLQLLSSTRHWS